MINNITKNKLTIYSLIVVVLFVFGIVVVLQRTDMVRFDTQTSNLSEFDIQKYLLSLTPERTDYVSNVGGIVTGVHTDSLVINYVPPQATSTVPYTVSLDSTTKLYRQQQKDPSVLLAEQKLFVEQGSRGAPPLPFIPEPISLAGIRVGDLVTIRLSEPQVGKKAQYALEVGVIQSL